MILLEVAVDDPAGLAAAVAGGADRVELCAALDLGGLTPTTGLMQAAARAGLPVMAMIRPRGGDFCYSAQELAVMEGDIAEARAAGLAGVVFGALTPEGALDLPAMARLCQAADGMEVTLHRAFDLTRDWRAAVDQAVGLGIARILTSGHAPRAPEGVARLAEVMAHAADRVIIMPGAGVSAETLPVLAALPLTEVHASCAAPVPQAPEVLAMGFGSRDARRTDAARVRDLKQALRQRGGE
jgi:copper homeostasis protein